MHNYVTYKIIFDENGQFQNGTPTQIDLICQPQGTAKQAVPRLYDTSVNPPVLVEKPSETTVTYLQIYDCNEVFIVVDETIETFSQDYVTTCELCKIYFMGINPNGNPNLYLNQQGNWTTPSGGGGTMDLYGGNGIIITGTTSKTISLKNGINFWYHVASYNDVTNGYILQQMYNSAKFYNPNGGAKTETNRLTILLYPGQYTFSNQLVLDTPYIDIVTVTGNDDAFIYSNTNQFPMQIGTSDIRLHGLNFKDKAIQMADMYSNLYIENLKGGDYMFQALVGAIVGNFKNCVGGAHSFGDVDNTESLIYSNVENCQAGDWSFGYDIYSSNLKNVISGAYSFGKNNISASYLSNCTSNESTDCFGCEAGIMESQLTDCYSGGYSFGRTNVSGQITEINNSVLINCSAFDNSFGTENINNVTFKNCQAGIESFGLNISQGTYYNCIAGDNSFKSITSGGFDGKAYYCIGMNPDNNSGLAIYCTDTTGNPINYNFAFTNSL